MARSFVYEVQIQQPVAKVWNALTDSKQLEGWLMANDFQPKVGHSFQFRGNAAAGSDGMVSCQVLEVTPQKRLSYKWVGGPMMDTTLTWELNPAGQGTQVKVTQSGFNSLKWGFVSLFLGSRWKKLDRNYLDTLAAYVSKS